MLTVKHIVAGSDADRVEKIYYGDTTTFCRDDPMGALQIRTHTAFVAGLWGGRAYVMNPEGKTVAQYFLPDQPVSAVISAAA